MSTDHFSDLGELVLVWSMLKSNATCVRCQNRCCQPPGWQVRQLPYIDQAVCDDCVHRLCPELVDARDVAQSVGDENWKRLEDASS
jgi:hypothetical protein